MSKSIKSTVLAAALLSGATIGRPTKANGKKEDREALEKGAAAIKNAASGKAPKGEKAAKAKPEPPKQIEETPTSAKLKFGKPEDAKVSDLVFSSKIQARESLNKEALKDYTEVATECKAKGADLPWPALKVVRRNGELLVVSGFTRGNASKKAELDTVKVCIADSNDISDAELFRVAIQENKDHGARLTNEDKKHNLLRVLRYDEFSNLTNNALVPIVGASEFFIRTHRPVNKSGAKRVTAKGKKINTGNIGKKTGATAKATTAAANLAANAAAGSVTHPNLDEEDTGTGTGGDAGATKSKLDDATAKLVNKIAGALEGHQGFTAKGIREGIEQGTIKVSPADLRVWAESSENRIRQIAPLVINHGWTPKRAYQHIDKEIDSSTKVDHLINSSLTTGGALRRSATEVGEPVADNPSFRVLVWDHNAFEVTLTPKQ